LPKALLLDLDGTLADTAPDLAAALNAVLQEEGRRPLPFHEVRPHVSFGAPKLVRLGFGEDLAAEEFERLRGRLLEHYARGVCEETRLFDGFEAVLAHLESLGIPWGIVTNKPGWLTNPLLAALGLDRRSACTVSGDTVAERKPHPLPLLHASAQIRVPPERCVYVGDAERDIQAGRAAGMVTVAASWGYIPADDDPRDWAADRLFDEPSGIVELVASLAGRTRGVA